MHILHVLCCTVVHLGLTQHSYEVNENEDSVSVCFELRDGALTGRPIVLKIYSSDGSAVGMSVHVYQSLIVEHVLYCI